MISSSRTRKYRPRRALGVLACAAAAFGFAASAAVAAPVPSDVGLISTEQFNGTALIYGIVTSKKKCLPNRKIKLTLIKAGGNKSFDVARTSDSGAWSGRGDIEEFNGAEAIRAKMAAKKVDAGGKTIKCGGDSQVFG